MPQAKSKGLQTSLGKLQIPSNTKGKKAEPADSWEDEADHASDGETTPVMVDTSPGPPPPTPSSPSMYNADKPFYQAFELQSLDGAFAPDQSRSRASPNMFDGDAEERRPDKSTSVASRLIAAGIGQKAPKRTKEQKEYDQAMKVQEKKKRDQAREDEDRKRREKERAIHDMWGE